MSRVLHETVALVSAAPAETMPEHVVHAYGDPDDHLRLVAILADLLGTTETAEAKARCLAPQTPWKDRLAAFGELLSGAEPDRSGWVAALVDPDGMFPSELVEQPHLEWDSRRFSRERRDTLDTLVAAAAPGGWCFVRPRKVETYDDLRSVTVEPTVKRWDEVGESWERLQPIVGRLSPALRPALRALLQTDRLHVDQVVHVMESAKPEESDRFVLVGVSDSLTPELELSATKLATLRSPQPVNGSYGPFTFGPDATRSVPREHVTALRKAGVLLERLAQPGHCWMPNVTRRHFVTLASWSGVRENHQWLADVASGERIEDQIETHHHAIAAGDARRALETASCYVADLRALAYDLSRQGRFAEATELYGKILEVDPTDAYAWEYKGYNLAQQQDPGLQLDAKQAYERANDLESGDNPLYYGRLLGLRAQLGEDVTQPFAKEMIRRLRCPSESQRRGAINFFAKATLEGMRRGDRRDDRAKILHFWCDQLREVADTKLQRLLT